MISRRSLFAGLVSVPCGVAVGSAAYRANRSHPAIRVIGSRSGMLVLVETGSERMLLLVGDVDDYLWRRRASLITLGRERVDVIVASHRVLTTVGVNHLGARESTQIISLQASLALPQLQGTVLPVTDELMLGLGEGTHCTIRVIPSVNGDASPEILVIIDAEETRSIIASSAVAGLQVTGTGMVALIVPGSIQESDVRTAHPELIVTTQPEIISSEITQLLVFSDSASELRLSHGQVRIHTGQVLS